jgi:predicted  nucleic acid-binding Zn-ribbon protein
MRFFSIKLLILCILLPPVLYLLTVVVLERHFQERFTRDIEAVYTGDPQSLLDGSVRLREALRANIDRFLRNQRILDYGIALRVTVATKTGETLYPSPFDDALEANAAPNPVKVAQQNFALLNEGLALQVEARVENNRLISNGILGLYLLTALSVLLLHYRAASRKTGREEGERRRELDRLVGLERANTERLAALQAEREGLQREFEQLKAVMHDERSRAERNEDDLVDEIEALEGRLNANLELQLAQQAEIDSLKSKIADYEKEQRRDDKGRVRAEAAVRKRFATLYKNIAVHDRAVEGFTGLNEELKLKAEEVIHQLDANPDLVAVKRKVFGKKNRETVLEVVFGYKGRLYFRRGADRRVEVLAVGTKNTQERELEFLANL